MDLRRVFFAMPFPYSNSACFNNYYLTGKEDDSEAQPHDCWSHSPVTKKRTDCHLAILVTKYFYFEFYNIIISNLI